MPGVTSGGNQPGASKRPPPGVSHRMCLIPLSATVITYRKSCLPGNLIRESVPKLFIGD